jgi:hypothetical protein
MASVVEGLKISDDWQLAKEIHALADEVQQVKQSVQGLFHLFNDLKKGQAVLDRKVTDVMKLVESLKIMHGQINDLEDRALDDDGFGR